MSLIRLNGKASVLKTIQFKALINHSKITPTKVAKAEIELTPRRKIPPIKTKVESGITNKFEIRKYVGN